MKKELKLNDVEQMFAEYQIVEAKQVRNSFMLRVGNSFVFLPKFVYGFIGGEIIPAFPMKNDIHNHLSLIMKMRGAELTASTLQYCCLRYEEGEDFDIYHAVDPLDLSDYTHIFVSMTSNLFDSADIVSRTALQDAGANVIAMSIDEYGLRGECKFILPVAHLQEYELVREYRAHLERLIEVGDKYYEDFERCKAKYFAELMQKTEILQQLDCWVLTKVGDESLIVELKCTGEKVEMRYDSIGMVACEQLLNRYRAE